MLLLKLNKTNKAKVLNTAVKALREGKTVVYPTDTSYGLAVDATNIKALKKMYAIKERSFKQPVHVVVPSKKYALSVAGWSTAAKKLAKKFWPGALTLVLPLKSKEKYLEKLSSNTHTVGLRMPDNEIALSLAKRLKKPISATSANPSRHISGGFDSYSAEDVIRQFKSKKNKPDIIIDSGRLPKKKPSTVIKVEKDRLVFLREGPVTEGDILKAIK